MAQPTTTQEWLDHWKSILYKISLTGQEYKVPGAQEHKQVSVEFVEAQIEKYEEKLLEESHGYNGQQVIK